MMRSLRGSVVLSDVEDFHQEGLRLVGQRSTPWELGEKRGWLAALLGVGAPVLRNVPVY